jgi:phosphoribosylaminoimidazolecarboxamide formyltransferase / IMP cyclohydrolase
MGQLLASGTGQTSRVDALEQAIAKAAKFNFDLKGAVMASDAFFPFPDCVEIAHNAGHHRRGTPGRQHPRPGQHRLLQRARHGHVHHRIRHFKH